MINVLPSAAAARRRCKKKRCKKKREKRYEVEADQSSRRSAIVRRRHRLARRSPCLDRARRGRHAETQMLVVAAERSEIRQRPRLLAQSCQKPESERARRADRGHVLSR